MTWRDVPPRPPTPGERRLLDALAAVVGEPLLRAQAGTALVDGVCGCGCSSVRLSTPSAAVPAARVAELSATGRDDHLAVEGTGRGPDGHAVDVVLHVVRGRLYELEVFDPVAGEGAAVDPATLTGLADPVVT
ncbi:hypothetical protein [Geodermatophilus sp. DSM 45219]|uniref:hypothetical protein n=1 Tax=Geodermatophilus sp. DSM 45219 TaxID=1881103 RepID=UPI00088064E3|nr:hypothetical protein [Geodermatophilus sp. DSM 45219]SDN80219.1 hypothetical protein SAMN05428965_1689 [Geodermatophilus sp. DSM 45219]